jgi:hypothetical protein
MDTPLPKVEEMKDILDLKGFPIWDLRFVWAILISICILTLAFYVLSWWRRSRARGGAILPPKTALEVALQKLDDLINSRLIEVGQIRRFYFSLSDLFREFIERELGILACEETLEELKPELKKSPDLIPEEVKQAAWLLDLADMAKFAKFVPSKEEILQSVKVCRDWMMEVAKRRLEIQQENLELKKVHA